MKDKEFAQYLDNLRKDLLRKGIYFVDPKEKGVKPNYSHINNSFCGAVVEKYGDMVKEQSEKDINTDLELPEHWFVKYNNKYYDAECIDGVDNPLKLPLFKNEQRPERKMNLWDKIKKMIKSKERQK